MIGTLIGLGATMAGNAQQNKKNSQNQQDQYNYQKQLNEQGQQLAMKSWNDTNYEAQMKHIKNAGLSEGLIYGGSGAGGSTTASTGSGGSVGMPHAENPMPAGMGLQAGAQLELLKAQKDNIEADTRNKEAEVPVKQAQAPNITADTGNKTQQLKESQASYDDRMSAIETKAQSDIQDLMTKGRNNEIGHETLKEQISQVIENLNQTRAQNRNLEATHKNIQADTKNKVTQNDNIQADTEVKEKQLQKIASEMNLNSAQFQKLKADIYNMNTLMTQRDREIELKRIATEYNYGDTAGIIRFINAGGNLVKGVPSNGTTTETIRRGKNGGYQGSSKTTTNHR